MSSHQFASFTQKRRSTRIDQSVPLVVQGVGAMREPYQEQVSTLSISCHGCSYQSKHEVIQGETVFLDIQAPSAPAYSSKARVKWAQKLAVKDRPYQIAVELEIAGNVWGVPSPPADWFPPRLPEPAEPASTGRELKVVARKEPPPPPADPGLDRFSQLAKGEAAGSSMAPLAQLMMGLGEQIQTMASEAASSALIREKSRLLEEFRGQLREEAVKTIQNAVAASKDVIVRQAMKELNDAHEAGARSNYAAWMKKVQQDMEGARQHVLKQGKEVSERLDGMAVSTIERVQRNMEATRSEAVERFVTRLRDQVVPMLTEAKESMQKLEASRTAFSAQSQEIHAGFESQLEFSANSSLARIQEDMDKKSTAVAASANETLLRLYQRFEKVAQENVEALLGSVGSQMTSILEEKAAEVSREFAAGLESYTRNYLESIGKSIAQIPANLPGRS